MFASAARVAVRILLCLTATAVSQIPAPSPPSTPQAGAEFFTDYDEQTFARLAPAGQKIDMEKIDDDLLSAAVFHETNKRRKQHGLLPLRHERKVRDAAQMQAEIMATRGAISHHNPEIPEKASPDDRVRLAGLAPGFVAENVGTAFGVSYKSGEPVYSRETDGKKLLSREPEGEAIPAHTYLTFARAWLDDLMASPLHRGSIISPKPVFLGVSCRLKRNELGMPLFYGTQVFYRPREEARR